MNKFLRFIAVVSIFTYTACTTDAASYDDELADLTERVESLEELRDKFKAQFDDLQTLVGSCVTGGTSISAIAEVEDGIYEITLSSGVKLEVGASLNMNNGVVAIRVNDGLWQYSQDGGNEWIDMVDADGNTIESGSGFDYWYSSVEVKDNIFTFVDTDGNEYSLPIIEGFTLAIDVEDPTISEMFGFGETREFDVTIEGTSSLPQIIATPSGWRASYADGKLSITAPMGVAVGSRVSADNTKDVTLMLISEAKFAALATVKVEVGVAQKNPIATVAANTVVAQDELTFDVTFNSHVTAWYYICQESSLAAPSIEDLMATTEQRDLASPQTVAVAVTGYQVEYTMYVLPVYVEDLPTPDSEPYICGDVVTSKATTLARPAAQNNYYEEGFEYDGVMYDKNTPGAVLLEANSTINTPGIYFLAEGVEATVEYANYASSLIIIGNKIGTPNKVTAVQPDGSKTTKITMKPASSADSKFILKNIEMVDAFYGGSGSTLISDFVVQDCKISLAEGGNALVYISSAQAIENVDICNNYINVVSKTGADFTAADTESSKMIVSIDTKSPLADFKSVNISNNYIFSEHVIRLAAFFLKPACTTSTVNLDVEISNNAMYNIINTGGSGFCVLRGVNSFKATKNVFKIKEGWVYDVNGDGANMSPTSLVGYLAASTDFPDCYADEAAFAAKNTIVDNIGFGAQDDAADWTSHYWNSLHLGVDADGNNNFKSEMSLPFETAVDAFQTVDVATWDFSLKAEYASYGPQAK